MGKGNVVRIQDVSVLKELKELKREKERFGDDMQKQLLMLTQMAGNEAEIIHKFLVNLLVLVSDVQCVSEREKKIAELESLLRCC